MSLQTERKVESMFQNLLGRDPTQQELYQWAGRIESGATVNNGIFMSSGTEVDRAMLGAVKELMTTSYEFRQSFQADTVNPIQNQFQGEDIVYQGMRIAEEMGVTLGTQRGGTQFQGLVGTEGGGGTQMIQGDIDYYNTVLNMYMQSDEFTNIMGNISSGTLATIPAYPDDITAIIDEGLNPTPTPPGTTTVPPDIPNTQTPDTLAEIRDQLTIVPPSDVPSDVAPTVSDVIADFEITPDEVPTYDYTQLTNPPVDVIDNTGNVVPVFNVEEQLANIRADVYQSYASDFDVYINQLGTIQTALNQAYTYTPTAPILETPADVVQPTTPTAPIITAIPTDALLVTDLSQPGVPIDFQTVDVVAPTTTGPTAPTPDLFAGGTPVEPTIPDIEPLVIGGPTTTETPLTPAPAVSTTTDTLSPALTGLGDSLTSLSTNLAASMAAQQAANQQALSNISTTLGGAISQLQASINQPQQVSTRFIQGKPLETRGVTLAESDLERRRGTVSRAFLGTKRLQTDR